MPRMEGINPNDAVMELIEMVDAAVGGSAHRVIAVTPWYGYSRQDKKSAPREPISARGWLPGCWSRPGSTGC